jgi:glutamate-ammonia-ligase adenylyltransferase
MVRAGDTRISLLEVRVRETQSELRRVFNTLIGGG